MFSTEYRLGEDLSTYDNILDPISFDDIILAAYCNHPHNKIDEAVIMKEVKAMLDIRLEDMWYLVKKTWTSLSSIHGYVSETSEEHTLWKLYRLI